MGASFFSIESERPTSKILGGAVNQLSIVGGLKVSLRLINGEGSFKICFGKCLVLLGEIAL